MVNKFILPFSFNLNGIRSFPLRHLPAGGSRGIFTNISYTSIAVRMFSTSKNDDSLCTYSSLMVFSDADQEKLDILKYVKGKSGIYM